MRILYRLLAIIAGIFALFSFGNMGNERGELSIADISAVLKKVIHPSIQSQIPKEVILLDQIKKNVGVEVSNNQIYISARTGKHSGIYSVAEGTEPKTGKAKYQQPVASVKYAFGTLELTDQAIEAASKGEVKAIAAILATEIQALKEDFKLDLNRQLHGAGTGILAQTTGTGANGTTVVLDSNPNGGDANEYFAEGMYVNFSTAGTNQISSLVGTTGIVLATATTWVDNEVITKMSAAEAMGLAGIIDDGDNVSTIQGITRSSNPWANSFVYDTAATLAEANMISTYLRTRRWGSADAILMGVDLYTKYGALLSSQKQTQNGVLLGGWKGLEFMGGQVGVFLDFDTWSGYVQMPKFSALTIAEMSKPFAWLEADAHGGILKRSSSNRTIWEGTMKYYFNLVALLFKCHARMRAQTV